MSYTRYMLLLGSSFENMSVLSLRSGTIAGKVVGHLINPHKLVIDALWVKLAGMREPQLLLVSDIREVSTKGVIIDDHTSAIEPSEAIRLQPIIDLAYELLGKRVISGHLPIGKVSDYAVETGMFSIQKLYANPSMLARFTTTKLTIDRSQIVEVSHKYVKITDSKVSSKSTRTKKVVDQTALAPSTASASTIEE